MLDKEIDSEKQRHRQIEREINELNIKINEQKVISNG